MKLKAGKDFGGDGRIAGAIFLLALAARVGAAYLMGAADHLPETTHHEHASIAKSLAEGDGFRFNFFGHLDRPVLTSIEAPLVPGLLAGSFLLFGVETPAAFRFVLLIQLLISSATVLGIGYVGGRLGGKRLGVVSAVLATFYPPLVVSCLHIQALPWNLFWLTGLLVATVRWYDPDPRTSCPLNRSKDWTNSLLFAAAGIGGLLTDPILAAPLLALLAFVSFVNSPRGPHLRMAGLTLVLIAIGIAPWTIRNYQVHGRLIFIKDSLPFVFWQGNCAASLGTDKLIVQPEQTQQLTAVWNPFQANRHAFAARLEAVGVNSSLPVAFIDELQSLTTEIARMDRFRDLSAALLTEEPLHYVGGCLRRVWYLLWFDLTNPRSYLWHYRISYLMLLALAAPTLCQTKHWRTLTPVLLVAGSLAIVHVLVITSARFRIPFELLLLYPAGLTILAVHFRMASSIDATPLQLPSRSS